MTLLDSKADKENGDPEVRSKDVASLLEARKLKETGNKLFNSNEYEGAVAKYSEVYEQLRPHLDWRGDFDDPCLQFEAAIQRSESKSGDKFVSTLTAEQKNECGDLQATVFLNMAVCYNKLKDYVEASEHAQKSVDLRPTIKGFYRLGHALKKLGDFNNAAANYEEAIKLDESDPNGIRAELNQIYILREEAALGDLKEIDAGGEEFAQFVQMATDKGVIRKK